MNLDEIDRKIIIATQDGLPLDPRPYHVVAEAVGIDPPEAMDRIRVMQEHGVIRRIGAVPNHYALGYRFNGMTVWDVADVDVEVAGCAMAALSFVSHCYQRPRRLPDWPYNMFAMVHARDEAAAMELVAQVADALGDMSRGHLVLFSSRILKKTGLRLAKGE